MNYFNLTAQQARHFIDTGKLLIVEKIEPKPVQSIYTGQGWLDWDDGNGMGTFTISELARQCPFASLGSVTRFREPWFEMFGPGESMEVRYICDSPSVFEALQESAQSLPEGRIRLSGKCVKVETRLADSMSESDAGATGVPRMEISARYLEVNGERYQVHPMTSTYLEAWRHQTDIRAEEWAWFATFEREK